MVNARDALDVHRMTWTLGNPLRAAEAFGESVRHSCFLFFSGIVFELWNWQILSTQAIAYVVL